MSGDWNTASAEGCFGTLDSAIAMVGVEEMTVQEMIAMKDRAYCVVEQIRGWTKAVHKFSGVSSRASG